MKMKNEEALQMASDALKLAHELNCYNETDGDLCRSAFRIASGILAVAFGEKAGSIIVEAATANGEYEPRDLLEYWKGLETGQWKDRLPPVEV
jgi:hypothetical protein